LTTQRRASPKDSSDTSSAREESARDALERARLHAQTAVSEMLSALRALLDAASLGAMGAPAEANPALRVVTRALDSLAEQLATQGAGVSPAVVDAVLDALDAEIARWELRSKEDPEARPVLRAFLGVREILWEVGLRRSGGEAKEQRETRPQGRRGAQSARPGQDAKAGAGARRSRVQRLDVKG
jgi:hypothetical protein